MNGNYPFSDIDLVGIANGVRDLTPDQKIWVYQRLEHVRNQMQAEIDRLSNAKPYSTLEQLKRDGFGVEGVDVEEDEFLDYEEWIRDQWWPDESTCATIDHMGGCCWWKGEPAQSADGDLGWEGDLIERYYDPAMPFDSANWADSLRHRPADSDAA